MEDLIKKIKKFQKEDGVDLSREEDLSIAVMNLISLEEHFFFSAEKTKNFDYLDLLKETREMRKVLMSQLIEKTEGESWCISKHLLAATMRLIEVGTKFQTEGNDDKAKETFDMAYKTYNLFWAIRLKIIDASKIKKKDLNAPMTYEDIVGKLVDCCRE